MAGEPRPSLAEWVQRLDADADEQELSERFLPFAALHHGLSINSPVAPSTLDRVIRAMQIERRHRVLDIACGNGGLLRRIATRTDRATGIDLSPWAIEASVEHLRDGGLQADLILGDAAGLPGEPVWDAIACVGAAWIFHGYEGTLRALRRRLVPGGAALIGDLRLRRGSAEPGAMSRDDQAAIIRELGGRIVFEEVSSDSAWATYGSDVLDAAHRFWSDHRAVPAADQRSLAARWIAGARADRSHLDFAITLIRFDR